MFDNNWWSVRKSSISLLFRVLPEMVLSSMKATAPPTNILVLKSTVITWSRVSSPGLGKCFYTKDAMGNAHSIWTLKLYSEQEVIDGYLPVSIESGLATIHCGSDRPKKSEKPKMKRLREEFMSTYCKFEMPTAAIIPMNRNDQIGVYGSLTLLKYTGTCTY